MPFLEIRDLHVTFPTPAGHVRASDGVDLEISEGDSLCLVGESGCGKTIVALAVMRLLPHSAIITGRIRFKGEDLLGLGESRMRRIRGREIAMIFEQPATCFNPVLTVGDQIVEAVRVHGERSRKAARERALELMSMVGIADPIKRYGQYPHEFSGGMIQRAMIAMALAFEPALLIADEPTTSLDVTVQAQIIELLADLKARLRTTLLLITHDLAVASTLCAQAAVMYAGGIVEKGATRRVFKSPRHPYTQALLAAASGDGSGVIRGSVPELTRLPEGCRFHPRCPRAQDICREAMPAIEDGVRCHLYQHSGVTA